MSPATTALTVATPRVTSTLAVAATATARRVADTASVSASGVAVFDTAIDGIALGMRGSAVLTTLGQPAVRTVAHGLGTPEWQYANGLTVQLTAPHNPARPDTIWEIVAGLPFAGATTTGFRLGDSEAQCRTLYQGLTITALQVRQLQIEAADGTLLGVSFDPNGKATLLTFSRQRILCANCGQGTRSDTLYHRLSHRENGKP